MTKQNKTVLELLSEKFEGRDVNEFMDNISFELEKNDELIGEWIEQGVDELSIKCQEEYADDLTGKLKLYKCFMTYDEVKEVANYLNKKGEECEQIFTYIKVCKDNFEILKEALWEICLGCSDAYWEEEIAREKAMEEALGNMKTMKQLRQFVKEYASEYYGVTIIKGHLVDYM